MKGIPDNEMSRTQPQGEFNLSQPYPCKRWRPSGSTSHALQIVLHVPSTLAYLCLPSQFLGLLRRAVGDPGLDPSAHLTATALCELRSSLGIISIRKS